MNIKDFKDFDQCVIKKSGEKRILATADFNIPGGLKMWFRMNGEYIGVVKSTDDLSAWKVVRN